MIFNLYTVCAISIVAGAIVAPLIRKISGLRPPNILEIMEAVLALILGLSLLRYIIRISFETKLQESLSKVLDSDLIVAIYIGSLSGIYLAFVAYSKLLGFGNNDKKFRP